MILDITSTERISKEIEILNNTKNQLDLTDNVYRTLYPAIEYTFFLK